MMKTSLLIPVLLSLTLFLSFTSCKKDPTKNAKLPPITLEGKNTIGFTLDGEVWVPYYECSLMGDPCGEISARYGETGGAKPYGIDFGFTRKFQGKYSHLVITSDLTGTITSIGDKIDSVFVNYNDTRLSNDGYFIGPMTGSKFIIHKTDFQNQIISGEFEFILRERKNIGTVTDNFITLKNGRFDFKFNACKCSG